jgi:hypothetical protein
MQGLTWFHHVSPFCFWIFISSPHACAVLVHTHRSYSPAANNKINGSPRSSLHGVDQVLISYLPSAVKFNFY